MKTCTYQQFLSWAKDQGIDPDPRYPQAMSLIFVPPAGHERFWCVPAEPASRPYLIASVLELAGDWQTCFAWRHKGGWPVEPDPGDFKERIEYEMLRGIGLPLGTADAVEFARAEIDKLITLVFSTTIFGWSVAEDLTIVPDHGQQIIKVSHHDVIRVLFRQLEDMNRFIKAMEEREWPLPTDVPDATFKRPAWMQGETSS